MSSAVTIYILVGLLLGGLQLAVGIVLGGILADRLFRMRGAGQKPLHQAAAQPGTAPPTTPREMELVVARLYRLVSEVTADVGSHRAQIERLSQELTAAHSGETAQLASVFLEAVSRALHMNRWLQDRLLAAEQKLQTQREQIERYSRDARLDPLTGLPNRRSFDDALATALKKLREDREPLLLFVLDLDHFKELNDRFGHPIGDLALRELGSHLRRLLGAGNIVARIGGEEFGLIISAMAPEAGMALAARLQRRISQTPLATPEGNLTITVSLGGTFAVPSDTFSTIYRRADQALYVAKRAGRNCAYFFDGKRFIRLGDMYLGEQEASRHAELARRSTPARWPAEEHPMGPPGTLPAQPTSAAHAANPPAQADHRGEHRKASEDFQLAGASPLEHSAELEQASRQMRARLEELLRGADAPPRNEP